VSPSSTRYVLPSLTRISDLATESFELSPVPHRQWRSGQYVAAEIVGSARRPYDIELVDGRLGKAIPGDVVIGVLGRRTATLQLVGSYEDVGPGMDMDLLSIAGVMGRCTSRSAFAETPAPLRYLGHAQRSGRMITMSDFVQPSGSHALGLPVILIVGTSMDAGKTMAGCHLVRLLSGRGKRVLAAKVTGVGRYRDVLAMGDAGAETILDFVDAGLPSSAVPAEEYEIAIVPLMSRMATSGADVAIIEAGASPLEPYNGDVAVRLLGDAVRMVVLCASDPYAALGVMRAFDLEPSFTTGRATSTSCGTELTSRLTGRPAIDLLDPEGARRVDEMVLEVLGFPLDEPSRPC
jgi:hypothetical protein